jgi:hypothetical protein
MERKIGEIFEFGGEWYQCIIGHCNQCSFDEAGTCKFIGNPYCAYRNDKKLACFKKLEKVGETYEKRVSDGTFSTFQRYKVYNSVILPKQLYMYCNFIDRTIEIEIKQTKEDMEEKKLNLKPFNLEAAKAGKPVCTRDGRKARIICFDRVGDFPIVALTDDREYKEEGVNLYDINGKGSNECFDLMMLPEKKEGWVNVYKERCYESKEEAIRHIAPSTHYIGTIKVEWEE